MLADYNTTKITEPESSRPMVSFKSYQFSSFYTYWIQRACRKLEQMDPSGYRKICHAKQVIAKNYLLAMKEIPLRTLILDIHRQKAAGNLRGSTPAEEYKDYNSRLLGDEEYTKRLCSEFPEMNCLLQQQTEYFVSLLGEVLGRLEKDRQEIVDLFCGGRDFSQIKDLDSSIADSHNGGKRAVRLELDNGTILYYKPHSLKKNQNYQKLYRFLCEKAELGCCDVKYLDEGTYGWEENMEYQACSQEGEAERYYKRIGIHLCLGYALSASDLHGENIVAHGEFPIVVDLETFPGYATERSGKTAEEKAGKILAASVLKTGMLPTLSWGSGKDTVLLSAMGGKEKIVTPFKMPVIKNGGTSEICIAYDTVTMKMSGSVVRLGETVLNAGDYASFVCSGFRTAYQALLEETDAMALLEAFFSGKFQSDTAPYAAVCHVSFYFPASGFLRGRGKTSGIAGSFIWEGRGGAKESHS
ncbi:MAG: type 2 lanthipeptide synthetase LanM [Lachnospiraceae bacterium]|nr:type 2 lanthipeptide synthetase LanM [Lachnospiraceae bacterium]